MLALDLFCGGGGSSMGLYYAGFNVVGVDVKSRSYLSYPFEFIQEDVFNLPSDFIRKFNLVWASPPCQAYTWASRRWKKKYPDLIPETRNLLLKAGIPFVIENVPQAPLRKDLFLCGEMFGLNVLRHRIFEIHGFKCCQPEHLVHKPPIFMKLKNGKVVKKSAYCCVAGHGGNGISSKLKDWQKAMGIWWIKKREVLVEAIPPAYSMYIAGEFLKEKEEMKWR